MKPFLKQTLKGEGEEVSIAETEENEDTVEEEEYATNKAENMAGIVVE